MCKGDADKDAAAAHRVGVVMATEEELAGLDATFVGRPHGLITMDGGRRDACCDKRFTGAGDAKAGTTGRDAAGRRRGCDGDGVAWAIIVVWERGVAVDVGRPGGLSGTTTCCNMPPAPMAGGAAAGDASDANGEVLPGMTRVAAAVRKDVHDPRGVGASNANDKVCGDACDEVTEHVTGDGSGSGPLVSVAKVAFGSDGVTSAMTAKDGDARSSSHGDAPPGNDSTAGEAPAMTCRGVGNSNDGVLRPPRAGATGPGGEETGEAAENNVGVETACRKVRIGTKQTRPTGNGCDHGGARPIDGSKACQWRNDSGEDCPSGRECTSTDAPVQNARSACITAAATTVNRPVGLGHICISTVGEAPMASTNEDSG